VTDGPKGSSIHRILTDAEVSGERELNRQDAKDAKIRKRERQEELENPSNP
jgi:hypothetical protein